MTVGEAFFNAVIILLVIAPFVKALRDAVR